MADEEKPFLPRWVMYLVVPGIVGPILVLGFIFVNEMAHDPSRCPYRLGSPRALSSSISVREDQRSCLWGIEDHRYTVLRGVDESTLGRRRFGADAFAPSHYHWSAKLLEPDEVQVSVHNQGHTDATFREGTPAERTKK
jgi:hypothetical protein